MRLPTLFLSAALAALCSSGFAAVDLPHLEHRGHATQLIVDGQPYLILGGEVTNTATSDLVYMDRVWPRLSSMNLNTVLVGASWALVEPKEGQFDFSGVDAIIEGARKNHLRLVYIWFGTWKNGLSSFAPDWVKRDSRRFPRVQMAGGRSLEIVSPLSEACRTADSTAFAAFSRHLKQVDGTEHTVLMIQLENEVGSLGTTRDYSAAAAAAYSAPVPSALISLLTAHQSELRPELKTRWEAAGAKTSGSWTELFGVGPQTDEIFMAWQYASYMNAVAAAGKAEYPLPIFTNTWIVQPEDKIPGDFPSGGPEPEVLDIWRAAAPSIDMNCPDIYLPEFAEWTDRFARPNNPLFVPESFSDATGAANSFYAIGQHNGLGYSPFGIDEARRSPAPEAVLPRTYAVLKLLTPNILAAQRDGTLAGASVSIVHPSTVLTLGGYELTVVLRRDHRDPTKGAAVGFGMFFSLGSDKFMVAGADIEVSFRPLTPGPAIAGVARAEALDFDAGSWAVHRVLNGDDIVIRYDLSAAANVSQSGSGLRFLEATPTIQRVELYRYE